MPFIKPLLTVGGPNIDRLNLQISSEIRMYNRKKAVHEKGSQGHHVRLNTQIDNGQTRHKNRILTYNLEQPSQETKPLICSNQSRKTDGCKPDLQEARLLSLLTIQETTR